MLALYVPGNSAIHAASAGLKLALLLIAGAAIAILSSVPVLAAALAVALALYILAGLSLRAALRALMPVFLTIGLFVLLQAIFAGANAAALTGLKATSLVLLASLVTFTTRFSDMTDALIAASRPLAGLGLSPEKLGLALAMAIRFIPVLMKDYQDVQAARLARGASPWGVLALGPLLVKTLCMANELAEAVLARGFEERGSRERRGK